MPTWLARAPRTSASSGRGGQSTSVTRPSASSVSLRAPNRTTVRYVLGILWTYSIPRVAAPTQTTRTPVASGSSVPACPTLVPRSGPTTRLTTSREVRPAGLFRFSPPPGDLDRSFFIVHLSPYGTWERGDGSRARVTRRDTGRDRGVP